MAFRRLAELSGCAFQCLSLGGIAGRNRDHFFNLVAGTVRVVFVCLFVCLEIYLFKMKREETEILYSLAHSPNGCHSRGRAR